MPTKVTTNKTKQDLLDEIADLKQQIANMEKYQNYRNSADEFMLMYNAFKDSGFSEDRAFELLTLTIKLCSNNLPNMSKMAMR